MRIHCVTARVLEAHTQPCVDLCRGRLGAQLKASSYPIWLRRFFIDICSCCFSPAVHTSLRSVGNRRQRLHKLAISRAPSNKHSPNKLSARCRPSLMAPRLRAASPPHGVGPAALDSTPHDHFLAQPICLTKASSRGSASLAIHVEIEILPRRIFYALQKFMRAAS